MRCQATLVEFLGLGLCVAKVTRAFPVPLFKSGFVVMVTRPIMCRKEGRNQDVCMYSYVVNTHTPTLMHTYMHAHTYKHTYIHTCIHVFLCVYQGRCVAVHISNTKVDV